MELRELHYFVTVVECQSMSKAARKLFVTQPTLSWNIRNLEEHFKTELVIRTNKGIIVSKAGKLLYTSAKKILNSIKTLDEKMLDFTSNNPRTINLGIAPFSSALFVNAVQHFNEHNPQFNIDTYKRGSCELQDMILDNDTLDLAIVSGPVDTSKFRAKLLEFEHSYFDIGIALRNDHPLASKRFLTLENLKDEELVTLSKDCSLYMMLESRLEALKLECPIVFKGEEWTPLFEHISEHNTVGILPYTTSEIVNELGIKWVKLEDEKIKRLENYLIANKDKNRLSFFDVFDALLNSLVEGNS
ncbi:hypothetical protein AOC36_03740 [Erysipelothrix larvae]|uniref:HTH lysR-type domain-containing protein n=1 Tax=Erysipelothrix larvae TaxID=1514105 RepID=A0A0X8GZ58_9FIRM|nr:LysR family transcriptional regulator [Erysipelothrix larvae]AMC93115.1 hypothetical protein AOC36_03740 [Erysipelothrix larvae]